MNLIRILTSEAVFCSGTFERNFAWNSSIVNITCKVHRRGTWSSGPHPDDRSPLAMQHFTGRPIMPDLDGRTLGIQRDRITMHKSSTPSADLMYRNDLSMKQSIPHTGSHGEKRGRLCASFSLLISQSPGSKRKLETPPKYKHQINNPCQRPQLTWTAIAKASQILWKNGCYCMMS